MKKTKKKNKFYVVGNTYQGWFLHTDKKNALLDYKDLLGFDGSEPAIMMEVVKFKTIKEKK